MSDQCGVDLLSLPLEKWVPGIDYYGYNSKNVRNDIAFNGGDYAFVDGDHIVIRMLNNVLKQRGGSPHSVAELYDRNTRMFKCKADDVRILLEILLRDMRKRGI
jgi:hypothetical protein